MKHKILLTSLLGLTIACPSFAAVDIAKNPQTAPGCTNSVLKTYTGPTDLEADYTANTINLNFYSDENTVYSTGTCTYDGGIELPEEDPTRTGYTFDGWQVRRASAHSGQQNEPSNPQQSGFDLSTWNYGEAPSWIANYVAWSPLNGNNGYTVADAIEDEELEGGTDRSASLSNGEWAMTFENGTVKGVSTCSTEHPTRPWYYNNTFTPDCFSTTLTAGDYNDTDKRYCWCKATSVDTGSGYQSVASARWVFFADGGDAADCAYYCAYYCADGVRRNDDFRSAVFGVAGD